MIQCPGCGAGLVFDIESQQMKCPYCSSMYGPYDLAGDSRSAEEDKDFEVTRYICPGCGGEIWSTEDTAAGFCSYCGSSNVLEGRLTREKRPEYIIPFKKTKADCKQAFSEFIHKALFAPNDYKSMEKAEAFRGIYMPYWLYDMKQEGNVCLETMHSKRSGDYRIEDYYDNYFILNSVYNGASYDASSAFADDISDRIAPYNVKDITEFTPAFLSGFYADIADVPNVAYADTAEDLAKEATYNFLKRDTPFRVESLTDDKKKVKEKLPTRIVERRSAMFPVWFMTYRNKDRVAYATVNGQTGRVSADIPVSIPKYLILSGIVSVILFLILQFMFTITPYVLLPLAAFAGLACVILYYIEIKRIIAKENYEEDKGMQYRMEQKRRNRENAQEGAVFDDGDLKYRLTVNDTRITRNEDHGDRNKLWAIVGSVLFIGIFLFVIGDILLSVVSSFDSKYIAAACIFVPLLITFILNQKAGKLIKKTRSKSGLPASLWTMIALGLMLVITLIDPASDAVFYGTTLLSVVGIVFTMVDLIKDFNLIAMRPLPQFETHKGGDDRA